MATADSAGVKALVFDVFGTCVDWRSGIARESEAFARAHGIEGLDGVKFADAWRALYQPRMEEVRAGRRSWTILDVLHRESLDRVIADFGLKGVPAAARDELNLAWHRLDPWPDVVAGLTRLKRKFIVAPLSNGNIALLLDMAKRAGIPWDAILGAEVARAYKPLPEAYIRTAAMLGMAPGAVMLVAAHNLDPKLGDVGWILVHTAGFLILWFAFLGLFLLTCASMAGLSGQGLGTLDCVRAFALTLIPIAVGYHFAHTFTYILIQGQSIIPLISDPFARGWDMFGTRDTKIDIAVMNTKTAWYLAVGAIVIGHSISVYLAHVAAERLLADRARAFRCLVPMTVLMVIYTIVSLQILAEPLVRYSAPQETII